MKEAVEHLNATGGRFVLGLGAGSFLLEIADHLARLVLDHEAEGIALGFARRLLLRPLAHRAERLGGEAVSLDRPRRRLEYRRARDARHQ